MRRLYMLITVGLLCGCQGTGPAKIDNPVVGPPPPRLPPEQIRENQLAYGITPSDPAAKASVNDRTPSRPGGARIKVDEDEAPRRFAAKSIDDAPATVGSIRRVSLETTKDEDLPEFDDSMVVAMVNDQPIFAGEVLGPHRPRLQAAEEALKKQYGNKYKPEMLHRIRAMFVKATLDVVIENKVLVQAAKASFKKNQYEGLCKSIDAEWTAQVEQMMERSNVTSINELEELLKEQHYDVREHAAQFREQKIALNYVRFKAHTKFEPTRKEMLNYYEEHRAEYEYPSRVQWQQLVIDNEAHGGEAGAGKIVEVVVQKLLEGADFTETIKKYGDGPKAANGGVWGWTIKGSVANKEVDDQLFSLAVGEMSNVIKSSTGYQIVQVLDRQDAGCKPFESLQKEIENKMMGQEFESRAKKIIAEHRAAAVITTIFDGSAPAEKKTAAKLDEDA